MSKFIIGLLIFCCITSLAIIGFLLKMNWNIITWASFQISFFTALVISIIAIIGYRLKKNWAEKLWVTALTFFIVAFVTSITTLWSTLKESNIEDSFTTSIPINEEIHLPPLFELDRDYKKAIPIAELSSLARPTEMINGKEFIYFDVPKDSNETFSFYEELLQYQLILDIQEIHRDAISIYQSKDNYQMTAHKGFKPKRNELAMFIKYPAIDYFPAISKNRFTKKQSEIFKWENLFFLLPKKTQLILQYIPPTEKTGPEKRKIIFRKPKFFEIEIIIEPSFANDLASVPKYLNMPIDEIKKYKIYLFEITMKSKFEWLTAGSQETQEYKKWANWLFSEIRNKYSIENDNSKE